MTRTATRWTSEALAARLRAQSAIDAAPRGLAALAAAEHLELLQTIEKVSEARMSPDDAVAKMTRISEEIRQALATTGSQG
jgi:phage shock protein A